MRLNNWYEKVVFYYIVSTYLVYLMGAQVVCAPIIALVLGGVALKKWYQRDIHVPITVWLWLLSSLILLLTIIMSHLTLSLGMITLIKAIIVNWGRGWALIPLFMLAGCLPIRPQVIYRAICILCLLTFIAVPIFYIGGSIHLPSYTSPLFNLLQGSESPFVVSIGFGTEDGAASSGLRFQLFTPWAPALGMIGACFFFLCKEERVLWLKIAGMAGASLMVASSVSRVALLALPVINIAIWYWGRIKYPVIQFASASAVLLLGLFFPVISKTLASLKNDVTSYRSSSSLTRERLYDIAIHRWYNEAFWWGHGPTEAGPKMVHHMQIGTHHTWANLLFTKGVVGFGAILLVFTWSFLELCIKSQVSTVSRAGLSILMVWIAFTFAENIDSLTYLFWPSIILVGAAFNKDRSINAYQTQTN